MNLLSLLGILRVALGCPPGYQEGIEASTPSLKLERPTGKK